MALTRTLMNQTIFQSKTSSGFVATLPETFYGRSVEGALYITFDHTSAAGTVLLESAPYKAYAGTWVTLGTVNWAAIDKAHLVNFSGVYGALRVRISSAVTSGTCDAWVVLAA